MNAQEKWKIAYHCWKEAKEKFSNFYESDKWANEMNFKRREAALERRIAAQQRTIEAQQLAVSNSKELFSLAANKIVELMDKCEAQEKQIETLRSELWQAQLEITWPEAQ